MKTPLADKIDSRETFPPYHSSVSEGIEFAMYAYNAEYHCNLTEVFYDIEKDCCLLLNVNRIDDVFEEEEELIKIVEENPERFLRFPTFSSERVYDLMWDFAEEYECDSGSRALKSALEGKKPMATFKIIAEQLNLLNKWFNYEYEKKEKFFRNWLENVLEVA